MTDSAQTAKPAPKKSQSKIVTIGGKRMKLTSDGRTTTAKPAPDLEWRLQAAAVSALRQLPEYATEPELVTEGTFTFAGDFNAGKRNATKANATGLTPGEADIRVYLSDGRMMHLELKAAKTPVSANQKKRHELLRALGHDVVVIRAAICEDMARMVCAAVAARLAHGAKNDLSGKW